MLLLTATPCQHQKGSIVVTGFCWCHYMVLFNFLKSREGRGWHGALYYTSPIVPPSGIGKKEGNYSRQRKGSSEISDGADQSLSRSQGRSFHCLPARPEGLMKAFYQDSREEPTSPPDHHITHKVTIAITIYHCVHTTCQAISSHHLLSFLPSSLSVITPDQLSCFNTRCCHHHGPVESDNIGESPPLHLPPAICHCVAITSHTIATTSFNVIFTTSTSEQPPCQDHWNF